jgi:hypothetical protein
MGGQCRESCPGSSLGFWAAHTGFSAANWTLGMRQQGKKKNGEKNGGAIFLPVFLFFLSARVC